MRKTSKSSVLEALAEQAHGTLPITPQAIEKARVCLADFLSCAMESADLPWSCQAADLAADTQGDAVIIGDARSVSVSGSAFANAVRGHGLVREDMHAGSISHLGVVVWPTLLALSAKRAISGQELLRAAVMGYELGGRLGRLLITPEVARLFRPTGLVGPMAAAMAGAVALKMNKDQMVSALSLAGNCAAGLNEWPHSGADEMYFHPGFAAQNAINSLRLAELGAAGSRTIIEGQSGLLAAFARIGPAAEMVLFPERDQEILSVFNKDVPACNFAQSPCQAALAAAQKLPGDDAIAEVKIATYDAALNYPGCNHMGPFKTPLQAKMSIAFGVAATLVNGEIAEANYSQLSNPKIVALIGKIRFEIDPDLNTAFPALQGAHVSLTTQAGETVDQRLSDIRFATPAQIDTRLRVAAAQRLGKDQADRFMAALETVGRSPDVADLVALCRAPANIKGQPDT